MVILDLEIINFDRILQQLMLDFFDYDILAIDEDEDIARYGAYAEGAIDALATDPADPSRALVIDYKTGGTPDETPDQLLEKHALQARVYADVLHKAGFETVTVKFVRVEQPDPTIFVEPAEPQVVTYNL